MNEQLFIHAVHAEMNSMVHKILKSYLCVVDKTHICFRYCGNSHVATKIVVAVYLQAVLLIKLQLTTCNCQFLQSYYALVGGGICSSRHVCL